MNVLCVAGRKEPKDDEVITVGGVVCPGCTQPGGTTQSLSASRNRDQFRSTWYYRFCWFFNHFVFVLSAGKCGGYKTLLRQLVSNLLSNLVQLVHIPQCSPTFCVVFVHPWYPQWLLSRLFLCFCLPCATCGKSTSDFLCSTIHSCVFVQFISAGCWKSFFLRCSVRLGNVGCTSCIGPP